MDPEVSPQPLAQPLVSSSHHQHSSERPTMAACPQHTLDGKLSFTFHKIQASSITKGIFYPSFFIMKLFDKTTEYCQCDFEAKYLDNTDFILS